MSSARTLAFLAKLPTALDEVERRWAAGAISADQVGDFCAEATRRFKTTTPERAALAARLDKLWSAAQAARAAAPAAIEADVAATIAQWREGAYDNLRDVLEECAGLLRRTAVGSAPRRDVLAVLVEVLAVGRKAAAADPTVAQYLGKLLDVAAWARAAGEPLPGPRPAGARRGLAPSPAGRRTPQVVPGRSMKRRRR